jgi:protein-S-isoprenylcysteine O-methyltransferase Ste14
MGFVFAGSSAFTAVFSRLWGINGGRLATSILRNMLGIPLYGYGLVLAWCETALLIFDLAAVGQGLGWLLVITGAIAVIAGHLQLGWRTHMPSMNDALMDNGLYTYVRHPIYAGGLIVFIGLTLVHFTAPWLLASILSILFFIVMAKLEEVDLLQRMPKYHEYMVRVPSFLPDFANSALSRWVWICPALGLLLATLVFYMWGFTLWTSFVGALMLVCPSIILWGLITLRN